MADCDFGQTRVVIGTNDTDRVVARVDDPDQSVGRVDGDRAGVRGAIRHVEHRRRSAVNGFDKLD